MRSWPPLSLRLSPPTPAEDLTLLASQWLADRRSAMENVWRISPQYVFLREFA
jgi:hypothetical protein